MTYYVYELVDPRDDSVFYVGKGKKARVDAHEAEARKGRVSVKCDRIREIWGSGLHLVKRRVASFSDEQEALDFEADLICAYGLSNLTNVAPGGGGVRGAPTIYEDRVAIRATAEGINRTRNGEIRGILINGQYLDLLPILQHGKERAAEIVKRRGLGWVNRIAARFSVEFANG